MSSFKNFYRICKTAFISGAWILAAAHLTARADIAGTGNAAIDLAAVYSIDSASEVDSEMLFNLRHEMMEREYAQKGSGIVEVASCVRDSSTAACSQESIIVGSGIVVLVGMEPMVLTASHVLAGRTGADVTVRFPGLNPEKTRATRVFDSPLADIALLKFKPKTSKGWIILAASASFNVQFCDPSQGQTPWKAYDRRNHAKCDAAGIIQLGQGDPFDSARVSAVADQSNFSVPNTAPWATQESNDLYISGLYPKILKVPAFVRPGMSGGAYYEKGILKGMLVKADLQPDSFAYAIPIEEIGRVIQGEYFRNPKGRRFPESSWITTAPGSPSSPALRVLWRENGKLAATITSSPFKGAISAIGGEAGNVGGEAGNVGEAARARYWKLEVLDYLHSMSTTALTVMTADPFRQRTSGLWVAEPGSPPIRVKAVKVEISGAQARAALRGLSKKEIEHSRTIIDSEGNIETWGAPTTARLIWTLNAGQGLHSIIPDSPQSSDTIVQGRKSMIAVTQVARLYTRKKSESGRNTVWVQKGALKGSAIDSGMSYLFPSANEKPSRNRDDVGDLLESMASRTNASSNRAPGYLGGWPFSSRPESDLRKRGSLLDVIGFVEPSPFGFGLGADLDTLVIRSFGRDGKENAPQISLKRTNSAAASAVFFGPSEDSPNTRAVAIFEDLDTRILDRIYIEHGERLFEFGACVPAPGGSCVR